ncbi:MAG: hypothetical protein ACFFDB_18625 [Promethearchaeota archaeon]
MLLIFNGNWVDNVKNVEEIGFQAEKSDFSISIKDHQIKFLKLKLLPKSSFINDILNFIPRFENLELASGENDEIREKAFYILEELQGVINY